MQANITADGALALRAENWSRKAFAAELAEAQKSMKMGTSVVDELRRQSRY